MQDRFKFRIPMFTDKGSFMEFQYIELGDEIECTLCGYNGEPQQCSGLKDKNGKLIYEGDIFKINTHFNFLVPDDFNYKYEDEKGYSFFKVVYNNEFARFELERIKWIKFETEHKRLCYIPTNHCIIGNIYKNKELLNG